MKNDKALRLWLDIGGIAEMYVEELEAEAELIAARTRRRRRVKYGTIAAAAASLSAAVAIMVFKPQIVTRQLARFSGVNKRAA